MSDQAGDITIHATAVVDDHVQIGQGTRVWHFAHICERAVIGERCVFGQNTMVASGVQIGDGVKVQNNVAIYEGVTLEDEVFLGPSCVLTNVSNPRSQIVRRSLYEKTLIRRGATIGANATIVCGVTIGRYAMIAAGAVVTRDVPDYAMILGVPGQQRGWVSRHGHPLDVESLSENGEMICPESGLKYRVNCQGQLCCIDLDEAAPLPVELQIGHKPYRDYQPRSE